MHVNARGELATEHLPIAPLRWERVEIRVDDHDGLEEVGDRLMDEMARLGERIHAEGSEPRALGVRPVLVGATRHYNRLVRAIREGRWKGLMRSVGKTLVFVDKAFDGLALAHDLEVLARGDDPAALMAQKLLLLKTPGEARSRLIDAARAELRGLADERRWSALVQERNAQDPLAEEAAVAGILSRAGTEILDALLEQRAGVGEGDG